MSDKDEKLIKRYSNKITNKLTREAIYTALVILIKQKPFESITVTDIVKKAGVSRTAYYNNYNTKKDILNDLVDSLIFEINTELAPYTDLNTGKAKEPEIFIRTMFEVLYKQKDIYKILYEANFNHVILDRLTESMQSQILDRSDENMYQIAFNAGALYNVFSRWITNTENNNIDEMTKISLKMYYKPMSEKLED